LGRVSTYTEGGLPIAWTSQGIYRTQKAAEILLLWFVDNKPSAGNQPVCMYHLKYVAV